MVNRKTLMALAAAMVMAVLYGCSGSDNSGLKNDLQMYKDQVDTLTTERDARITPAAEMALREALGEMELTPETLAALVARADITQAAYNALVAALPAGEELTTMTLSALVARADITQAEYDALVAALPAGEELTTMTLSELAGRADLTQAQYDDLMAELPTEMPLTVLNLRTLAGRADITAAEYEALMDAMGDMVLDVGTLEDLVARADITQAQYNALTAILPNLDATSLKNAVDKANYYTQLLAALGATGMSHADALALAMELVTEDTEDTAVDDNRVARKIAGLVNMESGAGDVADINAMLTARFGAEVVTDRKAAITGSGLSVGMLDSPGLQLEVGDDATMVPAATPAVTPNGFDGAFFNEALPGGRNLMTYAYTDVMDPWQEDFETAYGKLMVTATDPGMPPAEVENPGTGPDVTQEDIDAYAAYQTAKINYDRNLAAYHRDLGNISQGDFTGAPVAGGPSNTAADMRVVATAEEGRVDTEAHFWSLSRIDTQHLPVPPPREDDSAIVITDPIPVNAQYREEGHADGTSMLSGVFDGVRGNFVCMTEAGDGLCTIGAVRTDKEDGGTVRSGVEYSFDTDDTWTFVANNRMTNVATRRQDGDYLVMGWWLEAPQASTGDFEFGRFFAGSDPHENASAVTIPGANDSARYNGSAVGKYAERDTGTDTARKGLFTATAMLEADFEDDMIKGTVTNFVDENGASRSGWHVVLGESSFSGDSDFEGSTSGEAHGQDWTGAWNGEFYGRPATTVPSSVAGLFNATFGCNEMGGCAPDPSAPTVNDSRGSGLCRRVRRVRCAFFGDIRAADGVISVQWTGASLRPEIGNSDAPERGGLLSGPPLFYAAGGSAESMEGTSRGHGARGMGGHVVVISEGV